MENNSYSDVIKRWLIRILDTVVGIFRFAFFSRELTLLSRIITGISVTFLTYFIVTEYGGLQVLFDLLWGAVESTPDFVEGITDYFGGAASGPLVESLLVGGIFGAITTSLLLLTRAGIFHWPRLSQPAVMTALIAGVLAYYLDVGLGNTLITIVVVFVVTSYFYEEDFQEYLSLDTLKPLVRRASLPFIARGVAIGAVAGGIGSQIMMYPTQHCTYGADVEPTEYRLGLLLTIVGSLVVLLPVWSFIRRRRGRRGDLGGGYFKSYSLPYLFLAPTLFILVVFLYYPGIQVVTLSLKLARLGIPRERFVCMRNYTQLIESDAYSQSLSRSVTLTLAIVFFSMAISLGIAILASQKIRGIQAYRTLLIWPYAVSPVVAGVIFLVMFNPVVGIVNWGLSESVHLWGLEDQIVEWFPDLANDEGNLGIEDQIVEWFPDLANEQGNLRPQWFQQPALAPWVVIAAAVWNSLGFNILFYMAGLQSIPSDLLEAAAIDGANRVQRFVRVTFPLLSPYTFFLLVTNVTYSFFSIFGAVDNLTQGGPWRQALTGDAVGATNVLIYKVYRDAFEYRQISDAATQSLVLFLIVAGITILQFRFIEGRVTYGGEG